MWKGRVLMGVGRRGGVALERRASLVKRDMVEMVGIAAGLNLGIWVPYRRRVETELAGN